MKALITILSLLPSYLFAQDITGIWKGTLATSQKILPYEVVISDSGGVLKGYSHITFTVKGKETIAVKIIDVTNEDGIVTLEDEDIITNDLAEAGPKRVIQIANLSLIIEDSIMRLVGTFKTKRVTSMKPITGNIVLQKISLSDSSKLMAKLSQMDLDHSLSFLQIKKQKDKVAPQTMAFKEPEKTSDSLADKQALPAPAPMTIAEPTLAVVSKDTSINGEIETEDKKATAAIEPRMKATNVTPPVVKAPPVAVAKPAPVKPVAVAQPRPVVAVAPVKVIKAPPVVAARQVPVIKPTVIAAPPAPKPAAPIHVNQIITSSGAAADIAHRQIENIETFNIESDSILITLYDNGYVDGDTVSILLNGKVIMAKEGLSTHPITKMVYVTPDLGDSLQFVMYAENLGSIPPNTGLMILQDGKHRHEVFFSGDLQKNAAITLRRKQVTLN